MNTAHRLFLATVLLAHTTAASAHHSYAMYDLARKATVQGTVASVEWTNPHIWVWVAVDDGHGVSVLYAFESNAPSELSRFFGWHKGILNVGDAIRVEYSPLKSGNNGGALRTITFVDGRVLKTAASDGLPTLPVAPTDSNSGQRAK
jgi:hypothetical protein